MCVCMCALSSLAGGLIKHLKIMRNPEPEFLEDQPVVERGARRRGREGEGEDAVVVDMNQIGSHAGYLTERSVRAERVGITHRSESDSTERRNRRPAQPDGESRESKRFRP